MSKRGKRSVIFANERRQKILEIINSNKSISVPELCDCFGVSPSTIRSDLRELESTNQLKRTHGGAIANYKTSYEPLPSVKETIMLEQKNAIAQTALSFIEDDDSIAITTGTTTRALLQLLTAKKKLTVITNDINFAVWLEENTDFTIVLTGGFLRNKYHYTRSPVESSLLKLLNIDKLFLSCNGVNCKNGVTTPDIELALNTKSLMDASCEVFLLCDSSKVGQVTFAQISPLEDIDVIITDDEIQDEDIKELSVSCKIITVETGEKKENGSQGTLGCEYTLV
jgi:DeoR family fructose operon transcriptional repressor